MVVSDNDIRPTESLTAKGRCMAAYGWGQPFKVFVQFPQPINSTREPKQENYVSPRSNINASPLNRSVFWHER